jgi:hypothetical protein
MIAVIQTRPVSSTRMRKYGFLIALLLAPACKTADGPEPLVTTEVLVSSTPTQIAVNETAQANAIVKDQNGDPLTGKTIVWTSLNQGVATVNASGVIRGVSPGSATIQGTVDGVTGSATITVVQPVQSCLGGPTTLDIASGEVRVMSSSASNGCIKIASTSSVSSYVLIAANLNPIPDVVSTFALKSDEGETVPTNTLLANPYRVASQISVVPQEVPGALQSRFEAKLRMTEKRELNFQAGKRAYQSRLTTPAVRKAMSLAIPNVGDKTTFKVPAQFDASGNYLGGGCNKFTSATATVKYISNRLIIYVDDAAPSGGFTDAELQEIATEFDTLIYPTDTEYFGTPLDQDANSRIILLYTPLVNKLTPANQSGFVGGFFFVGDLFPSTGTGSCAQSNMAEIFYALAPDPSGTINNNPRSTTSVRQGTRGTIAHEVQHMINASERFRNPLTEEFESTWLDEGLAHFAEDLNGRVLRGLSETGNYNDAQLRASFNDYVAFFFQNFARFRLYLANPQALSPTSATADTSLATRGAAWAFVRYTADHYAPNGDVKAFIRALTPGPDTGVVNLTRRAGNVPFDSLDAGWLVANVADDAGIPNLATKYTYKTYNMRDATRGATSASNPQFPLQPSPISGSGFVLSSVQVRSGSGAYYTFLRSGGAPARSFRFLNPDLSTAASFTGAALILLRTQ